jgi:hypothetical protein
MQVSIFNQIYEHANIFDSLRTAQSSSHLSEWLKRQRESLLDSLVECAFLDDLLIESSESKSALLSRQIDLFISAIKNAESDQNSNLSFVTLILQLAPLAQKLSKQLKADCFEQAVQIALHACQPVLGDRRYIVSQQFLELMLMQQRFTVARQNIKANLKLIPGQIVSDIAKLSGNMIWKINMAQLENRLSSFLEAWLDTDLVHPLVVESRYCTLFIEHVVRDMSQPSNFWELLLLRIERQLLPLMEMISPATEVLIGSIERFDFIKLLLTDYQQQIDTIAPMHEMIILRMLFDARVQSDFHQRWLLHTPFNGFTEAGVSSEQLSFFNATLWNDLISSERCERLQVDWLKNAVDYCLSILQAEEKHATLILSIGRELDLLSAKITEGLTDSSGSSTISAQLKMLFLACRYASLATSDLMTARTLFRKTVVCSLSTEQYDDVWKKHREIGLALAQMDVAEQNVRLNMMQIQPLMRELDGILSDVVREGIQWWPEDLNIEKYAQDTDGARSIDLSLLMSKIGTARMVYGQRGVNDVLIWQAQWIAKDQTKPIDYSLLRKAITSLHHAIDNDKVTLNRTQILLQLRDRVDEVTAVKNLRLLADNIVDNTAVIGTVRYAELIKKKPELLPRGGNQQAWELSIPDNLWTLNRISYVYSRGVSNPFPIFAWWWNIAIAKNLRRLPLPLLATNVDALSYALFEDLSSDVALSTLNLIKAAYRESFGIDTDVYDTSPTMFINSRLRGKTWKQVFTGSPTKGLLFSKYSNAIRSAAPVELELIASNLVEQLTLTGDQEGIWGHCQLAAPMYSALTEHNTHEIESLWLQWQSVVLTTLPTGAGLLWNTVLGMGLMQLRQIGLASKILRHAGKLGQMSIAIKLQRHSEKVRQQASSDNEKDRSQTQDATRMRAEELTRLFERISVALMSQSPSMAALNLGRYMVMENATFDFSTTNWRQLWLKMDEVLVPHVDSSERQALALWTGQLLAMTELLPHVSEITKELLQEEQLIFADSIEEELHWREALNGLLAAGLTSNSAPYSGALMAQRLMLSCSAFFKETPNSWSERRQMLENAYQSIAFPLIKERLVERHNQIASSLFNRERLLESGNIEPTHQYSLMLSEMPWARNMWFIASLARQIDDDRMSVSHDDTLIATISGELPPHSSKLEIISDRLKAIKKQTIPTELVRKRWLSSQSFPISPLQGSVLKQLLLLTAMEDMLPYCQIPQQMGILVNIGFEENAFDTLSLFFDNFKQSPIAGLLGQQAIDSLIKQCGAAQLAWRLLQNRNIISGVVKQKITTNTNENIDLCIVLLGLFMGHHQAIVDQRLFSKFIKAEFFYNSWEEATNSLMSIYDVSSKQMTMTPQEQQTMLDFVTKAIGRQEETI